MSWQDMVNGAFEMLGGVMIFANVLATYRAKQVTGVSLVGTMFFSSWGYWNLYYYPHLNQWASFVGGVLIVAGNTSWIGLWLYYEWLRRRRNDCHCEQTLECTCE